MRFFRKLRNAIDEIDEGLRQHRKRIEWLKEDISELKSLISPVQQEQLNSRLQNIEQSIKGLGLCRAHSMSEIEVARLRSHGKCWGEICGDYFYFPFEKEEVATRAKAAEQGYLCVGTERNREIWIKM